MRPTRKGSKRVKKKVIKTVNVTVTQKVTEEVWKTAKSSALTAPNVQNVPDMMVMEATRQVIMLDSLPVGADVGTDAAVIAATAVPAVADHVLTTSPLNSIKVSTPTGPVWPSVCTCEPAVKASKQNVYQIQDMMERG